MKKIIFTLIFIFSLVSLSFADGEQCTDADFIFNLSNAQTIVVIGEQLQQCKILSMHQDEVIMEQSKSIDLLTQANQKLNLAYDSQEKANTSLKEIIKIKDEQADIAGKKCEEDIKKAKPGFFRDLGVFVGGMATGGIAVLAAILFL